MEKKGLMSRFTPHYSGMLMLYAASIASAWAQEAPERESDTDGTLEALLVAVDQPESSSEQTNASPGMVTGQPEGHAEAEDESQPEAEGESRAETSIPTIAVSEESPAPLETMKKRPPSQIEEIVVTVSKRQESLQKVLGSVSAITGDTLQDNNVQDFKSLVELIPGVVAQDEGKIAIRGISRTRDGPSPVAFHVNDVFIGTRGELFYDLGAVEVLRGPSGTLFGRNATAGAINAKWRRPEPTWSAGATIRYSGLQEKQLQTYVNIPFLGEDDPGLLGRLAAVVRRSDGTLDNLLLPDSKDPDNIREQFVRLYLTSELTENVNVSLRGIRNENRPDGAPFVASPSRETRRGGELERLGAQPLPDDLRKVRSRVHELFGDTESQFTRIDGDITWSLQDLRWLGNLDVVLVGGEMRSSGNNTYDLDGTEEPIVDVAVRTNGDVSRTAELRFVSQNDSGIEWLLGMFWFRQTTLSDLDVAARTFIRPSDLGPTDPFPGEPALLADIDVIVRNQEALDYSQALFLNFDFNLQQLFGWPHVEITAGLRNNWDEFRMVTERSDITIDFGTGPSTVVEDRNLRQFAAFEEPTGELGGRWFYSEEGMAYAKLSRGYKPGRAQRVARPDGTVIQNPVDPEYLNAFEAGWKTTFFDRTVVLNLAAFLYDYEGLQVSQIAAGGVLTENAATATIKGLEMEVQWSPSEAFNLQGSVAWMDATYDEYCGTDSARGEVETDPGCTEENPTDFSGARLTAAPRYSAALLTSYSWSLHEFGTITPLAKITWTDELDRRGLGNRNDRISAFSNSALRLAWESPEQRFRAEAFVENIENHDDIFFQSFTPIAVGARPDTFGLISTLPPRVYGLTLEARF